MSRETVVVGGGKRQVPKGLKEKTELLSLVPSEALSDGRQKCRPSTWPQCVQQALGVPRLVEFSSDPRSHRT